MLTSRWSNRPSLIYCCWGYKTVQPLWKAVWRFLKKLNTLGLPWWSGGQESTCQRGGHGIDAWPGKIPHAAEQLTPCTTTSEPFALVHASHTYWSRTTEGHVPRAHAHKRNHCNEKPMHRSEEQPLLTANRERPHVAIKTQHSQKKPQKLRTLLSYDPLPGVYPKELKAYVHTKTCT